MAGFDTEEEEQRRRRAEMQQALAILGSSYQVPDEGAASTPPARTDSDLPPRAAQALAAYQARDDLPTMPDRIRVREDRPSESLPEDNLGVANAPRFDTRLAPEEARDPETENYLRHTGKTFDDRSELERGNAKRGYSSEFDRNGYTNDEGTWFNGELVRGPSGPSVDVGPLTLIRQAENIEPYEERLSHGDVQPNPYEEGLAPEETNRALAMTGSDYRVPKRFDPRVSTSQLENELTGLQNESLRLLESRRDSIAASGEREAGLYRQRAEDLQAANADTNAHVANARAQQEQFDRRAMERLDRLAEIVGSPPQETRNIARNIMGAILSVASDGRVGDGREAMARQMAMDLDRWKAGIAANREIFDATLSMSKHSGSKAEQAARIGNALLDAKFGEYKAAFEEARATADTEEKLFAANQALNTLHQSYRNKERMLREQDEAASEKAERERARSEEDWNITRTLADLPEEHRATVAARIGPRAVELLANMQKNEASQASIEEIRAKTEKERRELTAGPKLTEGERKVDDLIEGIAGPNGPYARLEKIVTAAKGDPSKMDMPRFGVGGVSSVVNNPLSGWMVPEENVQQDADIQALTEAVLRAESGASITAGDIKAKADALGINSTDETVRARALVSLMQRARAIDNQGRLTRPVGASSKTRFAPDPPSIKQVVAGRGRGAQ